MSAIQFEVSKVYIFTCFEEELRISKYKMTKYYINFSSLNTTNIKQITEPNVSLTPHTVLVFQRMPFKSLNTYN